LISKKLGVALLIAFTLIIGVVALLLPRVPQPLSYHDFADQRSWLGIANFGDVSSNLLFAIAGLLGLIFLWRTSETPLFVDPRERWPYIFVFLGLFLTAFGSSYYHLAPDNARLVWDRLPMTFAFMGLVSAMLAERVSVGAGLVLLPVLLLIGAGSVFWWWHTESGAGDLRFYAAVQVYAVLILPLLLLLPPRYTRSSDFAVIFGLYVLAKILETADRRIFLADHQVVSGHTLKHLAAGVAGLCVLGMLRKRRPIMGSPKCSQKSRRYVARRRRWDLSRLQG